VQGPDLESARLVLKPHILADFDDSFAMWRDPRTVAFIGGTPSTPDRAWQRVLTYAGLWSLIGFGYWSVRERETGAFVGEVGFADFHRGTDPSFNGEPEMGWAIAPDHYGKGYATEAVMAALGWADAALQHPRTVCMIDPVNAASVAVARKCGFSEWTTTTFGEKSLQLYQRAILR
jgi:RimJ/RimL family protein N-acetyltransferase